MRAFSVQTIVSRALSGLIDVTRVFGVKSHAYACVCVVYADEDGRVAHIDDSHS